RAVLARQAIRVAKSISIVVIREVGQRRALRVEGSGFECPAAADHVNLQWLDSTRGVGKLRRPLHGRFLASVVWLRSCATPSRAESIQRAKCICLKARPVWT